jgi:hypothetical protein
MASTSWFPSGQSEEDRNRQLFVAVIGLRAFKAADEIEGMIAAQAMAAHHAAMECSRRAMWFQTSRLKPRPGLPQGGGERVPYVRRVAMALDCKRGTGGQQKVTIEHVRVHSGGQAVVGNIAAAGRRGEGVGMKSPRNPAERLPDWRTTLPLA